MRESEPGNQTKNQSAKRTSSTRIWHVDAAGLEATLVRGEFYTALSLPPSTYDRRTTFLFLLAALALSYPFPLLLFTDKYVNEN